MDADLHSGKTEIWLSGPTPGIPDLVQPVAHALLQIRAEVNSSISGLAETFVWQRPFGLAPPGFHIRHIAGVIDRMFTYAAGLTLSEAQFSELATENDPDEPLASLLDRLHREVERALDKLRTLDPSTLTESREVGRKRLPSTVTGLLTHSAEHGMRHVGQLITTVRLLRAQTPVE